MLLVVVVSAAAAAVPVMTVMPLSCGIEQKHQPGEGVAWTRRTPDRNKNRGDFV